MSASSTTSTNSMMKAVGYRVAGGPLQDVELPKPTTPADTTSSSMRPRDLLIQVLAVSVNPIDCKLRHRQGAPQQSERGEYAVLGFDCVGTVEVVGVGCSLNFKAGDRVYYAGDITRPGTNSEYHLVDERLVGRAPTNLSNAEAAALPLTTITAYEMLLDRLRILDAGEDKKSGSSSKNKIILIVGGAGGVGSIAIQLVRALAPDFTVIATASRPETVHFCQATCGAHHVIDHSKPLAPQVSALQIGAPSYVFSTTHTDQHMPDIVELMAPQGHFGLIDDPKGGIDIMPLKRKSISIHWELMFTRSMYETADMVEQHNLLETVANLVEQGKVKSTLTTTAGPINAATLEKVHALIESGKACGKIVLEGFETS